MGKELDKNKPHSTVWGDDSGRAFAQDGQYFDGQGMAIEGDFQTAEAKVAAATKAAKPAAAAPAAKPAADAQVDKQLAK